MDELQQKLIKKLAIDSNNEVWNYLQKDSLTSEEISVMLENAYSSLHLWSLVGKKINTARGHWLISRAYCVANIKELAMVHALLCDKLTKESDEKESFDQFYSLEALARANAANENFEHAQVEYQKAILILNQITDQETKQICSSDLEAGPWFDMIF